MKPDKLAGIFALANLRGVMDVPARTFLVEMYRSAVVGEEGGGVVTRLPYFSSTMVESYLSYVRWVVFLVAMVTQSQPFSNSV